MPKKTNTSRKGYKAAPPPAPVLKREPSVGEAAVDVKSAPSTAAAAEIFGRGTLGQRIRLALADALTLESGGLPILVLLEIIAQYTANVLPLSLSVLIGTAHESGYFNGAGTDARLHSPLHLAMLPSTAGDYLLLADSVNDRIRKFDVSNASGSLYAGAPHVHGLAVLPNGRHILYSEWYEHKICRLTAHGSQGVMERRIGGSSSFIVGGRYVPETPEMRRFAGYHDGTAPNGIVKFNYPAGLLPSRDSSYCLVADSGNNRIRKLQFSGLPTDYSTVVSTIIGNGLAESVDGPALKASLDTPLALVFDWTTADPEFVLYIATKNGLRKYDSFTGEVSTVKSTLSGEITNLMFVAATQLLVINKHQLHVVDTTTGETCLVAMSDGSGSQFSFTRPVGLALMSSGSGDDGSDSLYVSDAGAHAVYFLGGSIVNARL